jgi:hypothetical protein
MLFIKAGPGGTPRLPPTPPPAQKPKIEARNSIPKRVPCLGFFFVAMLPLTFHVAGRGLSATVAMRSKGSLLLSSMVETQRWLPYKSALQLS